jgi:hypothetical protein
LQSQFGVVNAAQAGASPTHNRGEASSSKEGLMTEPISIDDFVAEAEEPSSEPEPTDEGSDPEWND